MRCVDVNVLVYAHRQDAPHHEKVCAWLELARRGPELLGIPAMVSSGFLRIVTHPRIFREPTPLATAFAFLDELHASPASVRVAPGERHWEIFTELCTRLEAKGNEVPDVYLAAIALEHGATWVSTDRAIAAYPGLRVLNPTAS
jgi:toxin-antitoxin system PIN domain toxin